MFVMFVMFVMRCFDVCDVCGFIGYTNLILFLGGVRPPTAELRSINWEGASPAVRLDRRSSEIRSCGSELTNGATENGAKSKNGRRMIQHIPTHTHTYPHYSAVNSYSYSLASLIHAIAGPFLRR